MGTVPVQRRKARVNALCSANPTRKLTSAIETSGARRKASARSRRTASTTAAKLVPAAASRRCSVRAEVPSRRATRASEGSARGAPPRSAARTAGAAGPPAPRGRGARARAPRASRTAPRPRRGRAASQVARATTSAGTARAEHRLERRGRATCSAALDRAREGEAHPEPGRRGRAVAHAGDEDRERVLLRGRRRHPVRRRGTRAPRRPLRLDGDRAARIDEREVGRDAREPLAHRRAGRAEEVEHPEGAERRLLGSAERERGIALRRATPRARPRPPARRGGGRPAQSSATRVDPRAREERGRVEAEPRARVHEGARRDGEDGRSHGGRERITGGGARGRTVGAHGRAGGRPPPLASSTTLRLARRGPEEARP